MPHDPLAPSNGVPPRQVEAWTQVDGHIVTANGDRALCICGERSPSDWSGTGRGWRDGHLRTAWPVLVPQVDGESPEAWLARISDEYVTASAEEDRLYKRDGHDRPIPEGGKYPVLSDEYTAAGARVEVLEHQINEVRSRVQRRLGLTD